MALIRCLLLLSALAACGPTPPPSCHGSTGAMNEALRTVAPPAKAP